MIRGVALALLLAACSDDPCPGYAGTCVRLVVDGDGDVDELRLAASGAFTSQGRTASPSGPLSLPVVTRLELAGVSGVIDLEIAALLAGAQTGQGRASISLRAGEHRSLSLGLQRGDGPDQAPPDDLSGDGPPPDLFANDLAMPDLSGGPCAGTANVMHFDGDPGDFVFDSIGSAFSVTAATWSDSQLGTPPHQITINLMPTNSTQGAFWNLTFASPTTATLAQQTYPNAVRFATTTEAGLDVGGNGRGCNMTTGQFTVEQLVTTGSAISAFTASFEQHCDSSSAALRGCVHYQK